MTVLLSILGTLFVALIVSLIRIRYKEVSQKRANFNVEYSKFAEPLLHFSKEIQDEKISLNYSILTEFKNHESAKDLFVSNLRGRRLKKFNKKWEDYEDQYKVVKDEGVTGVAVAIAPNLEALQGATPDDARKWEFERKNKINSIITELLKIAKVKIWL